MKKGKQFLFPAGLALLLAFVQQLLVITMYREAFLGKLPENPVKTDVFRQLEVSEAHLGWLENHAASEEVSREEILAVWMVDGGFSLTGQEILSGEELLRKAELLNQMRAGDFSMLTLAYRQIFGDLEYFPVPLPAGKGDRIVFDDTFGASRSYGGQRSHEGTDLFGTEDVSGYYPVISVTDGIVENVGWLPLGGWRIGIRSPSGGYFYYAHLDSYGRDFREGDDVRAGELLGLMGDTGYGPEGTRGKFPVHLHFGIYIRTEEKEEISVNPYAVLRHLENTAGEYTY